MSDIHLLIRSIAGTWISSSPLPASKYKKEISIDGTFEIIEFDLVARQRRS
jgi:hypothetical protein